MTTAAFASLFDSLAHAQLPDGAPAADSGWCWTADRRQRVRLLVFGAASPAVRFRAYGEPLLLVLADELCRQFSGRLPADWPPVAELVWPIDVPTASTGLLLALTDAVGAIPAAAQQG